MIPLMKNAFYNECNSKKELAEFIVQADRLSMSVMCEKFEKEFSVYNNTKNSVLFNSGGSANLAVLQALKNLGKLKEGDKIGFSALTWSTNVMPIIQLGMVPVAIDVDKTTLNVMSSNLTSFLEDDTIDAFFITHALGFSSDMCEVSKICEEHNIVLIEDSCEALGTEVKDKKTGTFGIAGTHSFFVAHHMSTIEGGMVSTSDEELANMLKIVRANGWDRNLSSKTQREIRRENNVHSEFKAKYSFYDLGYNLRPTEITGFLGVQQLKYLEKNVLKRSENHEILEENTLKNSELIYVDHKHIDVLSAFAFPVIANSKKLRDKYIAQFSGAGVEIRPVIAGDIQKQPFYRKYVKKLSQLPNTTFIHENGFYFGNYPELTEMDLEILTNCLTRY